MDWNERVRIIYAGDDVTDEDAMTQLKGILYYLKFLNIRLVLILISIYLA